MSNKTEQINFCMKKVIEILDYIRPGNEWDITYAKPENTDISDWKRNYLQIMDGEDYFFISVGDEILYAINVTGDSTLTAIHELIDQLAKKF